MEYKQYQHPQYQPLPVYRHGRLDPEQMHRQFKAYVWRRVYQPKIDAVKSLAVMARGALVLLADASYGLIMSCNDAAALHGWPGYRSRADYERRGITARFNPRLMKTEYIDCL